jgi:hypothetical protein
MEARMNESYLNDSGSLLRCQAGKPKPWALATAKAHVLKQKKLQSSNFKLENLKFWSLVLAFPF